MIWWWKKKGNENSTIESRHNLRSRGADHFVGVCAIQIRYFGVIFIHIINNNNNHRKDIRKRCHPTHQHHPQHNPYNG